MTSNKKKTEKVSKPVKKQMGCVGCQSDETSAKEAFKLVELLLEGKILEARGLSEIIREKSQRRADEYIQKTYINPLMKELGRKI